MASSGFPPLGTASNNLVSIAEFLMSNGYSRAAAAGIAGTIAGESGGNPESVGSGGGGLIGWTPIGSAKPDPILGKGSQADWNNQLTDLLFYLQNEGGNVNTLKGQTDPQTAAQLWSREWEKPARLYSDIRSSTVTSVYNALANYKPNSGWTQPGLGNNAAGTGSDGAGGIFSWPSDIIGFFSSADTFVNKLIWLATPSNWVRIVAFIIGLGLLLFAAHALLAVGEGGPIMPKAPKVVPIPV